MLQPSLAATLAGLGAVLLWGALSALTASVGAVPPFLLSAMTFVVATLVGIAWSVATGEGLAGLLRLPPRAWAIGIYGLLGFHACYFFALQAAPALEASLIVCLWPLLLVLLTGLLPARLGGRGLGARHLAGALMGLAGTVLVLRASGSALTLAGSGLGYGLALAAAVIWSSYSAASRLLAALPSVAVTGFCAATAVGSALIHLAAERTVWPAGPGAWAAVAGLGLGPVGLAFYLWDVAMKRGDIRLVAVSANAVPLLSAMLFAAFGLASTGPGTWGGALLIALGAAAASPRPARDGDRPRK